MYFFQTDMLGFALATLLAGLICIAPGFGIARLMRNNIIIEAAPGLPKKWELLIGITTLPIIGALLTRFAGLNALIVLYLFLAFWGIKPLYQAALKIAPRYFAIMALWWAIVAWSYVDFDIGNHLSQSLLVIDLVKHSAVVHSIATTGVPLQDPFFLRESMAGYYYYFYLTAAAIDRLGGTLVDSRMAFASTVFSLGLSFPVLLCAIADHCGWIRQGREEAFLLISIAICCVSGLDLLPAIILASVRGQVDGQIDWWADEISFAFSSIMWVPHHTNAVIASFLTFMLLCHARTAEHANRLKLIFAAGLGFASIFGLSTWIALGTFAVLTLWIIPDLLYRRYRHIADLALAGIISLILSLPQFADLLGGRHMGDAFLKLWIKPPTHPIELGFFLLGTVMFFRCQSMAQWLHKPLPRLLLISAAAGITLNLFVRSAILYNDFGWRVIWFALLPIMIWTAVALQSDGHKWVKGPIASFALIMGIGANIWSLTGWRLIRPPAFTTSWSYVNAHGKIDYEIRKAYMWTNAHLPPDAVLQHNPGPDDRIFNFGLYSNHRVALADGEATLFGAPRPAVAARLATLEQIFAGTTNLSDKARSFSIDYLMITSADGLWRKFQQSTGSRECVYKTRHVCVVQVEMLP
jgi:hypothetical protein